MTNTYYVYIMTNKRYGVPYIGMTNDIGRRLFEHSEGIYKSFTRSYKLRMLVYAEAFNDVNDAIRREKQLKRWDRQWKLELIDKANPGWEPLNPAMFAI